MVNELPSRTYKTPDGNLITLRGLDRAPDSWVLQDDDIDTSDIPEVTDWSKAEVGKFYRPKV